MKLTVYEGEVNLAFLRGNAGVNQVAMADRLQITQPNVSRIEARADSKVSSLHAYVQALGGHLVLLVILGGILFRLSLAKVLEAFEWDEARMHAFQAAAEGAMEEAPQGVRGPAQEASPECWIEPEFRQPRRLLREGDVRDLVARKLPMVDGIGQLQELTNDPAGRKGKEYVTDVGRIDLLTTTDQGDFCVWEFKLQRGGDAALGQLLRYMGFVQQRLAAGRKVYGVIVAAQIDEKLRLAVTHAQNVSLLTYEVNIELRPV